MRTSFVLLLTIPYEIQVLSLCSQILGREYIVPRNTSQPYRREHGIEVNVLGTPCCFGSCYVQYIIAIRLAFAIVELLLSFVCFCEAADTETAKEEKETVRQLDLQAAPEEGLGGMVAA